MADITVDNDLLNSLLIAAGKLATVSDQAAVVLSEEFEDLVRPSIDEVRRVLEQFWVPSGEWDGTLKEHDLTVTTYAAASDNIASGFTGVKIVHGPTGIGRQSDSKPSQLQNREVALKALTEAVRKEAKKRGAA